MKYIMKYKELVAIPTLSLILAIGMNHMYKTVLTNNIKRQISEQTEIKINADEVINENQFCTGFKYIESGYREYVGCPERDAHIRKWIDSNNNINELERKLQDSN